LNNSVQRTRNRAVDLSVMCNMLNVMHSVSNEGIMRTLILKNGGAVAYRRLKDGDQIRLKKFHNELSEKSQRLFTPHAYDDETLAKVVYRSVIDEDRVYIALDDKEVIVAYFFLWWYSSEFPVLGIGIADQFQGLGLGRQLIDILIEDGRTGRCSAIELTTMPNNEKAFALYQKLGFQYLGKVDNLAGDGSTLEELHMYYPIEAGVKIPERKHVAPV